MQTIVLSKEVSINIKFNGLGNFQCLDNYNIDTVFLFSDTTHVASFLHLWCIFFSWKNNWKKILWFIYFLFPYCFENLRNISLNKTLSNFILLWNSRKMILIEISAGILTFILTNCFYVKGSILGTYTLARGKS